MEWKKVRNKGEDDLTKLRVSVPIKEVTSYPAKTTHLGCCKPPNNHEQTDRRQASPLESFDFKPCSSIFFFSLPKHTSREQASSLIPETPAISSLPPPSLPIFPSVVQPRSLMKLSSSCWKYAKATHAFVMPP
ncbi:hypothetical protein L3X38_019339 [Prunus dulcis]|uniref:Uncharacterized protein n=1 Tax=Prunus dulcis TaxID=3755 RepID=A0AAD4WAR7_PRUDU|nr:hypothetical protein L3X38_019339 [Prunus dulcis]